MRLAALTLVLLAARSPGLASPLEVPFIAQQKNGCGAASVAMVLHYWGSRQSGAYPPPEDVYIRLYRTDIKGVPLAEMRRFLEEQRFRAYTLRGEPADIEEHVGKGRPVIVGLKKKRTGELHFVVVTGLEGGHVWLNDPTRKKPSRLRRADFEKRWALADRWMLLATPPRR